MPDCIVFDIETGPLPKDQLEPLMPPFDQAKVKGAEILVEVPTFKADRRLKDEEKIAQNIEEKRIKHAKEVEAMMQKVEEARQTHWEKQCRKAALSALTGRVLAIGYFNERIQIDSRSEQDQLLKFWDVAKQAIDNGDRMLGFNILGFDLPFLARRSWLLGLSFPLNDFFDGRYWSRAFVDLFDRWKLGWGGETVSLDRLAKALGLPGKPEGVTGADYAKLWETDRNAAKAYLANDLKMTRACAEKLGCLAINS